MSGIMPLLLCFGFMHWLAVHQQSGSLLLS